MELSLKEKIEQRTKEVEAVIYSFLPEEEGYQKTVISAMNYTMQAGGKRLRPMLMEETYRMFGGSDRGIIEPFMAAIEMIHTYSLIHDDLPALDNDDYRRGRKTAHVVYGEAMAILAGDALLNFAFETAASAFDYGEDPGRVAKALQILAKKAGVYGMIGGQVVDVQSSGHAISKERLDFIYKLKTSALLEAAMMTGAVLAGAAEEEVRTIEQVASDVGVAFQVRDDILDVTGTLESIGKPVHSDDKNEKTTYVTLKGLEQASADVEELSDRALRNLASLPYKNEFLTELIQSLVYRDR